MKRRAHRADARRPSVRQLETSLTRRSAGTFTSAELDGLPGTAHRYLSAAIAPAAVLARSAHLTMRGEIKLKGRWLGYRARQVLTPQEGFAWSARVAGVVIGSDQFISGRGWMSWKLAGLWTVGDASGPDVSRSAAGRGAGETCWLPTMWLPRFGASWTEHDRTRATVRTDHGGQEVACVCTSTISITSAASNSTVGATPTRPEPSTFTRSAWTSPRRGRSLG